MHAHRLRSICSRQGLPLCIATCLFLLVAVCGFVASRAQAPLEGERVVVEKIPKHLPIKVKVKQPEKVKDLKNEHWLGELELEVTNTGSKPIYFLEIVLDMPDVFAPNGLNYAYPLHYGRSELISLSEPVRPNDVPIHPGEVVILSLRTDEIEGWKRGRAKGELSNPKKIEFFFYFINFGDGTGFVTNDGKPLPERKERSAVTCAGDESAVGVASVKVPPRYYFPELASLVTFLPRPVSLTRPFFIPEGSLPEPGAAQDLCCASGCSRLKPAQDQGCPCVGLRNIVQPTSCSDTLGSCGTIKHSVKRCFADGVEFFCEESFINTTCAAPAPTPTPTPTPDQSGCTQPPPASCCVPEIVTVPPSTQYCRWNCREPNCGDGGMCAALMLAHAA